jgi:NAD(P)-dependent dehydrogenase (short-subunit alcohol dehydrogenase family)
MAPPGLDPPPPLGASALPAGTFAGQVVVVTGGGTGLGKAIATEFGRLGASVAVVSRDADHRAAGVASVLAAGGSAGGTALGVACDIRDADGIAAAFSEVEDALGPIGVLVNNAAGNFPSPAEDLSPNAWRTVVDIVLNGTFLCCRELARRAMAAGRSAAILNIGASYAWTGGPGFAHSAAAKAGVKNLTETLAVEWAPAGIRVNGLVPGLFPHEDEVAAIAGVPGRDAGVDDRVPALRVGAPRELGWAATFLCSPYASYVSGHTMVVDGANWQRRNALQAPFVPIREQLERGPFDPDGPDHVRRPRPPTTPVEPD